MHHRMPKHAASSAPDWGPSHGMSSKRALPRGDLLSQHRPRCASSSGGGRGGDRGADQQRRNRANPGCINDATIHPPVPSPLPTSPYKHYFVTTGSAPSKDERPIGLSCCRVRRFEKDPPSSTSLKLMVIRSEEVSSESQRKRPQTVETFQTDVRGSKGESHI